MKVAIIQNVSLNDHRMVHTDGIGRELINRGYDVEIIIQESKEKSPFGIPPYKIIDLPGDTYSISGQIEFMYNLIKLLKEKKYNIIHAKNPFSSILPVLLLKRFVGKTKIIYDIRGLWVDFGVHAKRIPKIIAPLLNKLDNFCMNRADKVIAISYELRDILVRRGVKETNIKVIIGDGVDVSKAESLRKKEIRDFFGIDGKVIGYVGSIALTRYSNRIIEAFKVLKNQVRQKVNLVMMGPLNDEKYFQSLIRKEGLEGSVFFTKFITSHDEVLQFMKSLDIAVAYHEVAFPFFNVMVPTKVLEYLATGRSIVATDHKSHRNLLTHRTDAYLTGQNPKEFADGILHLLENEEFSERLSKNAQITAKKHSFEKVADKIVEVYKTLLN